jgi:hypothetical protein
MEALEILGRLIELIYCLIAESRRVPDDDETVSYIKPIKLAYGFSHKICITI